MSTEIKLLSRPSESPGLTHTKYPWVWAEVETLPKRTEDPGGSWDLERFYWRVSQIPHSVFSHLISHHRRRLLYETLACHKCTPLKGSLIFSVVFTRSANNLDCLWKTYLKSIFAERRVQWGKKLVGAEFSFWTHWTLKMRTPTLLFIGGFSLLFIRNYRRNPPRTLYILIFRINMRSLTFNS